MNFIFKPFPNAVIRYALRPFASMLPRNWHPRVNGVVRVRLEGRDAHVKVAVNPTSYLGKVLYFRGMKGYEWASVRVFMHLAEQSGLFLDVGANIGYYALVAAGCNPRLRITCLEPSPDAYHYLLENIRLNGFDQIDAHRLALAAEEGTVQFYVSRDPAFEDVEHHLTTTGGFNRALSSRTPIVSSFEVATETLDAFVARRYAGQVVDLIKLDVEASEHLVLRGASEVLRAHRPTIFCEVLPGTIETELQALFEAHGYVLFRATERGLVRTQDLRHGDRAFKDHVMVHPDRLSTLRDVILEA